MEQNLLKVRHYYYLLSMSKLLLLDYPRLLNERFLQTDLGRLYQAIPFDELAAALPGTAHSKSGRGCKPWLDVRGGIALLILKHYTGLSDALLTERLNTDWGMQQFCGILLKPHEQIKDTNLPGYWRTYIGKHLDINKLQQICAAHWKGYMNETNISMEDATCYESRISHPTDIKLLWQSIHELYLLLQSYRKQYRQRKTRSNYTRHKNAYLDYQRTKKKTRRKEKRLRKQLLKYLNRLIVSLEQLQAQYKFTCSNKEQKKINTIRTIYSQQHQKAYGDGGAVKDRIVSLSKPYIRPIVRGKETKTVEFGAKVNKLQVDGISFIQHFSYDAFNEGTQLQNCICLHRRLFGKCTHHSADAIYATNANRKYCTQNNIVTNFIPKGKQKLQDAAAAKTMRAELNKQRGTVLEGSFGNEKNHYLLGKVNARNEHTEKCWIFFGMLTSNAVNISRRIQTIGQARAA